MMNVSIAGTAREAGLLVSAGSAIPQLNFTCGPPEVTLHLIPQETARPFFLRDCAPCISTFAAKNITHCTGSSEAEYLLLLAMLALIQWRAIHDNPLLMPEDLLCNCPPGCLFAPRLWLEQFTASLKTAHICGGCAWFYGQLCPADEIAALTFVLARCRSNVFARHG